MATKYPALMAKAMFINVMIEGTNPTTAITKTQTTLWASNQKLPFSVFRDVEGAEPFTAKKVLGIKMTTYVIERATRKIVVIGENEADTVPELEKLP